MNRYRVLGTLINTSTYKNKSPFGIPKQRWQSNSAKKISLICSFTQSFTCLKQAHFHWLKAFDDPENIQTPRANLDFVRLQKWQCSLLTFAAAAAVNTYSLIILGKHLMSKSIVKHYQRSRLANWVKKIINRKTEVIKLNTLFGGRSCLSCVEVKSWLTTCVIAYIW